MRREKLIQGYSQNYLGSVFPRFIRRLVLSVALPFILLQLIFVPLYLGFVLDGAMGIFIKRALLSKELFESGRVFTDEERMRFYKQHNLRGVVHRTQTGAKNNQTWFIFDNTKLDGAKIFSLDKPSVLQSYKNVFYFMGSRKTENIILMKTTPNTGEVICAVIDESIIATQLRQNGIRIVVVTTLLGLFIILSVRLVLGRELTSSLKRLERLLGTTNKPNEGQGMLDHIREQTKLASLGAGAARIAHDLRNMLTSLQLYAERLSMSDNERDKKMGERMMEGIQRAVTLCDWTKHYSSDTRRNLDRKPQQVRQLVKEVFTLVGLHDVKQTVKLVNRCDPEHLMDCEHTLVFRIIYNITLNAIQAIQASGKTGRVSILSLPCENGIMIQIKDSGPGMDEATVEKLFVPYTGSLKLGGTGLGMAIAKELALWHDGSLELLETSEHGSCFQLFIPNSELATDNKNPEIKAA